MLSLPFSLLIVCSLITIGHSQIRALTPSDIDDLREDLMNLFDSFSNSETDASEKPLIASAVRLAFHDCAGPMNRNHESIRRFSDIRNEIRLCDGCIQLNLEDHAGLEEFAVIPLEELYIQGRWDTAINRADFWAAAGTIAIEYASSLSTAPGDLPRIDYYFGREECSSDSPNGITIPGTDGTEFPLAHLGWDDTFSFFDEFFDFDVREVVTILGAHTLGRAHPKASGFDGQWTEEPFWFDNEFYKVLSDSSQEWTQTEIKGNGFPQWKNRDDELFMLNADIGLVAAMENDDRLNHKNGIASCRLPGFSDNRFRTCQPEVSRNDVIKFANDNQGFLDDFVSVWEKLLTANQVSSIIGRSIQRVVPNRFRDTRIPSEESEESEEIIIPLEESSSSEVDGADTYFCCISSRQPNFNGRCWGMYTPQECNNVLPVGERCYWDSSRCRTEEKNDCGYRLERCEDHSDCCSDYCSIYTHQCR